MEKVVVKSRSVLLGALTWLFASTPAWAVPPAMEVTPSNGTEIISGQPYKVRVDTPGQTVQMRVIVVGKNAAGTVVTQKIGPSPLEFDMLVPWEDTGPFSIGIDGELQDPDTGQVVSGSVDRDLFAMPNPQEIPTRLNFGSNSKRHRATAPLAGATPETLSLGPQAIYADGRDRNVQLGRFGTTYVSTDPNIATVDADGLVTAVSPGIAFVEVEYLGVRELAQISVEDPITGQVPIIEYTSQVVLNRSGFRRDPSTGLFIQQVTFTNTTPLPIPRPIHLVVSDLPQGVWMPENRDGTDDVQPIGSPIIHVEPPDDSEFLVSGATATALLKFENQKAVPINYTLRLFGGNLP